MAFKIVLLNVSPCIALFGSENATLGRRFQFYIVTGLGFINLQSAESIKFVVHFVSRYKLDNSFDKRQVSGLTGKIMVQISIQNVF